MIVILSRKEIEFLKHILEKLTEKRRVHHELEMITNILSALEEARLQI